VLALLYDACLGVGIYYHRCLVFVVVESFDLGGFLIWLASEYTENPLHLRVDLRGRREGSSTDISAHTYLSDCETVPIQYL